MHLGEPAGKRSKQLIWGVIALLILLFLIFFWKEVGWVFGWVPADKEHILPPFVFLISIIFVSFILVALLWVVLLAFQALLPITDFLQDPIFCLFEAYRTAWHLLLYIFHMHGPAIFVEDGKQISSDKDLQREGPGVVVVDFNSAVVLEERNPPPGLAKVFNGINMWNQEALLLSDPYESPRVRGAGIVFMRPRERIRGVVDLRKQFRMQPKVSCYTLDGIELYANVNAIFTIGQDPDILQVTYVGEYQPENLRVVNLANQPNGDWKVTGISDELDPDDQEDIHQFAMHCARHKYEALLPTDRRSIRPERVFAAVFAQAHSGDTDMVPWTDLPTRVASNLYREILSQTNYDELYDIKEKKKDFPLKFIKSRLTQRMRSNGILSVRLLFHRLGAELTKDTVYREADLRVSNIFPLTRSKVLRDRGIKILASGFGDLTPLNEDIYRQRLDAWKATWEQETKISLAIRELEAMRVSSRAHAEAQQDLWYSLSQIFNNNGKSEEALAIRVMQALDQAASDPETRALLPENTIELLRHIHNLLLPKDKDLNPPLTPPVQ